MKTDQVVDFVMEALPEDITKEQVKASVSVGQMNDVKIMPLYITTGDAALSEEIAQAYVYGLGEFARSIEGLSDMQCWLVEPAVPIARAAKTGNAVGFGAVLGAILAFLALAFLYILDDSIYLEEDFRKRCDAPLLGILTRQRLSLIHICLPCSFSCLAGACRSLPGCLCCVREYEKKMTFLTASFVTAAVRP